MDERCWPIGVEIAERHESYRTIPIGRSMFGHVAIEHSSGETSMSFRDAGRACQADALTGYNGCLNRCTRQATAT